MPCTNLQIIYSLICFVLLQCPKSISASFTFFENPCIDFVLHNSSIVFIMWCSLSFSEYKVIYGQWWRNGSDVTQHVHVVSERYLDLTTSSVVVPCTCQPLSWKLFPDCGPPSCVLDSTKRNYKTKHIPMTNYLP